MEKFFKLKESGTDVKTELTAGVITFLSMVYILAINPSILSGCGMDAGAVFTATAISAAAATLFMAFFANYPIALASGMGLNAYFSYSVCGQMAAEGISDPWTVALAAVLVEGIIFILLSLSKFREALVNDVPTNLKLGISTGIGLFIVIVGLKGAGIVVADPSTILAMGDIATPSVALAFIGLIAVAVMYHYKVPGYILWGILLTWILGMIAQACGWYVVDPAAGANSLFPDFSNGIGISAPYLFAFNFDYISSHLVEFAVIVFAFLFVDLFDTAGTVIGVANKGGMLDENGDLPRAKQVLLAHGDELRRVECRRCRRRSHGPRVRRHRRAVPRRARARADLPRHPELCHDARARVRRLSDDVVGQGHGLVRRLRCRGRRLPRDHYDAVHLLHRKRHHVRHPGLRRDPHLPGPRQGGPLGHVGFDRTVRAAHHHARRLGGTRQIPATQGKGDGRKLGHPLFTCIINSLCI